MIFRAGAASRGDWSEANSRNGIFTAMNEPLAAVPYSLDLNEVA